MRSNGPIWSTAGYELDHRLYGRRGSDLASSVPFGEYMPMGGFFRLFSDQVDRLRAEFLAGTAPENLDVAGVNVGNVICFEVVQDDLVRDVVNGGAQLLVVQTNNATFDYTNETYQQQAMSRVRAVEHGRDVLIAATSGVSAVIRSDGSVESTIGLFTPGYLTPEIGLVTGTTLGTVLGGPVEGVLAALSPLALAAALILSCRSPSTRRAPRHSSGCPGGTEPDLAPPTTQLRARPPVR